MKTEFERISEIMYTLLEHQPVIDVPYEKINDIAIALVKEGYGKISEYENEKEMLGSQIKVLKQRLNNKYVEVDNLSRDYSNAFERLKAQEREIEQLKAENCELTKKLEARLTCDFVKTAQKQAQIDVLNKLKNSYGLYYLSAFGVKERMLTDILNPMIEELKK